MYERFFETGKMFKTQYRFIDVVLASVAGATMSLIPVVGEEAPLVGIVAVLYWRLEAQLFSDILLAVLIMRLAMVPVLLLMRVRSG